MIRAALERTNIEQKFEEEIEELEDDDGKKNNVNVVLSSGESISSKLLVVCEGGASKVAQMVDARSWGWSHNQKALVCNLEA